MKTIENSGFETSVFNGMMRHYTEKTTGIILEVRDTLIDLAPFNWQDRYVNFPMKEIMSKYAHPASLIILQTEDGVETVCFGRRFDRTERRELQGAKVEHTLNYIVRDVEKARDRKEYQLYTLEGLDDLEGFSDSIALER